MGAIDGAWVVVGIVATVGLFAELAYEPGSGRGRDSRPNPVPTRPRSNEGEWP